MHCKADDGYCGSGCILVSLVCHRAGADGPSTRGRAAGVAVFGCADRQRCTWRRIWAARRRRWRWSRRARTCNARTTTGMVLDTGSSCRLFSYIAGRTVRPLGVELRECRFWLCRRTALHFALNNDHTETALALALVKAGADVHCKAKNGCGFSGCILVLLVSPMRGGRAVRSGWSCSSAFFGCAGVRRCTWHRLTGARRRRWH